MGPIDVGAAWRLRIEVHGERSANRVRGDQPFGDGTRNPNISADANRATFERLTEYHVFIPNRRSPDWTRTPETGARETTSHTPGPPARTAPPPLVAGFEVRGRSRMRQNEQRGRRENRAVHVARFGSVDVRDCLVIGGVDFTNLRRS